MTARTAAFDLREQNGARVLALEGDWTVWTVSAVDAQLRELAGKLGPGAAVDVSGVTDVDVAGAYLIGRTLGGDDPDAKIDIRGDNDSARKLIEAARAAVKPEPAPEPHLHGMTALFDRTGRGVDMFYRETLATLGFLGMTLATLGRLIRNPSRIRWASVFSIMETAGLNALPIIAMLSFFIGVVVAYLGARVLGDFGASIFTVELVAFSVLREFGVVITCVLLAGRTDSAFTAEIGAMKMRQEIDALRVLGVDPMEALVAPRVIAMLVMTPILTFVAMIAGLIGGMLVCQMTLQVSPVLFFQRISDGVPVQHFWVGMLKAPVFALVLAQVGCRHGLQTGSDVASLGARVTASVVQAIFLVIVLDALFALWFLEMNW